MIKTLLLALSVAVLPGQAASPPAPRTPPIPMIEAPAATDIQFTITRRTRDDRAQLSLTYGGKGRGRSQNSGPQAWNDLRGLDPSDLDRDPPAAVAFEIVRPAGTVACSGVGGGGTATGGCRFAADEGFEDALASRVGSRPETRQLFQLALSDFRLETLDELQRQDYPRPDLNEVVAMGIHGVDAAYVRGIAGAGYRLGSVEDLIGFRIHGVTPAYIAEMAALGASFSRLPASDLMAMRIHGVTPAFAREMAALGYGGDRPNELVAMRIHRITPEFVGALATAGYRELPAETLMAFGIHGVTPEYMRAIAAAGYPDLSPDHLVAFRIHGVTPEYIEQMAAAGHRGLAAGQLISLRIHGADNASTRRMTADRPDRRRPG